MEAEVKIKASMQIINNNIEAQARKQGQKAGRAFQEGAKRTAGKGGIFDMLKSNGGVLNGLKGVLTGGGIKSLLNPSMLLKAISGPIGVAMTAITGAFVGIKLMMEAEAKRIDRQIGVSQQRIADKEEEMKQTDDKNLKNLAIIEKLNEYVQKYKKGQVLSDSEIKNAIDLVKELDKSYKGLGISVNTLTRSVDGFDDSLTEMIKNNALQNKIKKLEQLTDEYNELSNSLTRRAVTGLTEKQIMAMRNIGIQFNDGSGLTIDFKTTQEMFRRSTEYVDKMRKDRYAKMFSFFDIDSSGFLGGWNDLEKTDSKNGIVDLTKMTQKQREYEKALQEVENSLIYKLDKAVTNLFWGTAEVVSDATSPYLKRAGYNLGLIDYDQTNEGKLDKLFDFSNLTSDEKINEMKSLINQFAQARDMADTQQKADSLQKVIENLKKMIKFEEQRNKLIQERDNLQKNIIKQKQQEANIIRSNEWLKQEELDKKIQNFNNQREWDNADTNVEKRRILEKKLSDYQTSRKNLHEKNDEIASKTYGDEAQKSENANRLKNLQQTLQKYSIEDGFRKAIYDYETHKYHQQSQIDQLKWAKTPEQRQRLINKSKLHEQQAKFLQPLIAGFGTYGSTAFPEIGENQQKQKTFMQRLQKEIKYHQERVFLFDAERAKDSAQIAKNETEIKNIMLQELKIKKQMEEIDKRKNEYFGQLARNEMWNKEKFRAQTRGDWDSYIGDEVQVEDSNNKWGLSMQEKIDLINQKKRDRQLNVRRMIFGKAENMYDSMLPNTYEGDVERTIRELERANQVKLQPEMIDKIKQLLKIKWDNKDMEENVKNLEIITNPLTARGGFAGGAWVPEVDYQRNSMELQRQNNRTLDQIKQVIIDLGKI